MSRVCYLCEKSTIAGKRVQHKHSEGWRMKAPKSNRIFKPNLMKANLEVDGKPVKATICMKCYKKLKKEAASE